MTGIKRATTTTFEEGLIAAADRLRDENAELTKEIAELTKKVAELEALVRYYRTRWEQGE